MDMKGISTVIATVLMLVITIALAGTVYIYSSNILTTATQGIEIVDNFCDSNSYVTVALRNLGTNPLTGIQCLQTAPSGDTCDNSSIPAVNIAPGAIQTFSNFDQCQGSGSRFCQYRLTPNSGRTIVFSAQCTGTTGSTTGSTTTTPPSSTTTTTGQSTTTTTSSTTTTSGTTTTTTSTTTTTTTTISLPSGINDYWKFDDGSGSIATDSGPNGIFGQLINSPAWVTNGTCRSVDCLGFNGPSSPNYLDMGTDIRLNLITPTHSFTIVAWIRAPPTGVQEYLVDKRTHGSTTDAGYSFYLDTDGSLNAYVGNGTNSNTTNSPSNVTTRSWQMVTLVVDRSENTPSSWNMLVYVNVTEIGLNTSLKNVNGSMTNTAPFRIGVTSNNAGNPFKGMIDEVMIYNRALVPSEIASLYSQFAPTGTACCAGNNGASASCTSTNGASSWTINGALTNFCENICSSYGKSCVPFSVCTGSSGDTYNVKGYAAAGCTGNSNTGSSCQTTTYNTNPSVQCCCK